MGNPTPPIPSDVSAGQPARAVTMNDLLAAVRDLSDRVASLEGLLGLKGYKSTRLAAWVVSVTTGSPSTIGNTTYTVRLVGQGTGGDLGPVAPANRPITVSGVPITPAAVGDQCWIVRSSDATGAPLSRLIIETETYAAVVCA